MMNKYTLSTLVSYNLINLAHQAIHLNTNFKKLEIKPIFL